jgi:hypothetical protein
VNKGEEELNNKEDSSSGGKTAKIMKSIKITHSLKI